MDLLHFLLPVFFVYGLVIGSFLNVCIYRLPLGLSVAAGRSFCPGCHHTLGAPELVPLFSFLFQRGRCRHCGASISPRYPLVELLTAVLYTLCAYFSGGLFQAVLNCLFLSVLVVVAFVDIDTREIPDRLHLIILALSIINLWADPAPLWSKAAGAIAASLPMLLLAVAVGGFGGADIKLMAAAGLYLGFWNTLLAFLLAVIIGGTYAAWLLLTHRADRKAAIPFCPALAAGIAAALLWGNQITVSYFSLF